MNKEELLSNSKVFCMAPWVHAHTNPIGDAHPCCIAKGIFARQATLDGIVNSEGMKSLRKDMLAGNQNSACVACYKHEEQNLDSFRQWFNREYGDHLEYSLTNTQKDGTLKFFKMRYFDLRFNNICNFKCRTCNASFSSQWEQEDLKRKVPWARILPRNTEVLSEVLEHVPYMEHAYFAGGEPLITEEHYVLLEEMIRLGKTDIKLKYNSNVSNLKFKNKDIVELWSKFTHPVEMAASIDHYGPKAEYIRSGTDWAQVEKNLLKLRDTPNVRLNLNSVVSIFNYVSYGDFVSYLDQVGILAPDSKIELTPYSMVDPFHLAAQALPLHLKDQGKANLMKVIASMQSLGYRSFQTNILKQGIDWVYAAHTWEQNKEKFRQEVADVDAVRRENFVAVFPELGDLLND
jgi:organic radical activating enzyme